MSLPAMDEQEGGMYVEAKPHLKNSENFSQIFFPLSLQKDWGPFYPLEA